MMSQQITKLFEQKEQEIMNDVVVNAQRIAKQEMKLFELELFCSAVISDKEQKEVTKWVEQKRKKDWQVAFKEAKGNLKKAMAIFCG